MQAFTDYPFRALGDKEFIPAPIREVTILSYDGDKYCRVAVGNIERSIKAGYLYKESGRHGEVPCVTWDDLGSLVK